MGASIQDAWTSSLDHVRAALDADPSFERTTVLRASAQELGASREAVLDAVVQRLELSQKQAAEAYRLAEEYVSLAKIPPRVKHTADRHRLPAGQRVSSTAILGGLHHEYRLEDAA